MSNDGGRLVTAMKIERGPAFLNDWKQRLGKWLESDGEK